MAPAHDYPSYLELRLTATDSGGLQDTQTMRLDPRTVTVTMTSEPPGLSLTLGGGAATTPFTRTVLEGSTSSDRRALAPGPGRHAVRVPVVVGRRRRGACRHRGRRPHADGDVRPALSRLAGLTAGGRG